MRISRASLTAALFRVRSMSRSAIAFFVVLIAATAIAIAQNAQTNSWVLSIANAIAGSSVANWALNGSGSCGITLTPSTSPAWSGTVTFEAETGAGWQSYPAQLVTPTGLGTAATTASAGGLYSVTFPSIRSFSVRLSANSAGSVTVGGTCGPGSGPASGSSSGGGGATAAPYATDAASRLVISPSSQPTSYATDAANRLQISPSSQPTSYATDAANRLVISPSSQPSPYATDAANRLIISPSSQPTGYATDAANRLQISPSSQPTSYATDSANRLQISPSSQPSPCATYSAGVCENAIVNTVAGLTGGPYAANANPTSPITLSGVHAGCDLETNGGWIGTIAAQTQGSGTPFLSTPIYPQSASSTAFVSSALSTVQAASSDYWIDTSGKMGVELVITNYALGSATLRCDVAPPQWVEAIPVSAGQSLGGKVGFTGTTLAAAITTTGTQAVAVASTSGLQKGMSVSFSGTETLPLLAVYPGNSTVVAAFTTTHANGDAVTPSASQTLTIPLGGQQNSLTIRTDASFNGTIVVKTSNGSSLYTTTDAIGTTSAVSTALFGYPYASMTGASASWSVPIGSELSAQIVVTGATAGSFVAWADVGRAPPLAVISQLPTITLPTFGAGATVACPAGNSTTPPALTGGPNGVRIGWTGSTGSITYVIAASQPSSPASTIQQVLSYSLGGAFNEPVPSGYAVYVVSSTACVYRAI